MQYPSIILAIACVLAVSMSAHAQPSKAERVGEAPDVQNAAQAHQSPTTPARSAAITPPSDAVLRVTTNQNVTLHMASGEDVQGQMMSYDAESVVLQASDGEITDVPRAQIRTVRIQPHAAGNDRDVPPPGAAPKHAQAASNAPGKPPRGGDDAAPQPPKAKEAGARRLPPSVAYLQYTHITHEFRHVGAAKRIPGSIVLGVGAVTTFSSLVTMLLQGVRGENTWASDVGDGYDDHNVSTGTIVGTTVGLGLLASGAVLLVLANHQRRQAIKDAKKVMDLAVAPAFYPRGAGAQMHMRF